MIPESIQQEAHALKLDGVESIYVIIPQEHDRIDMAEKEKRMFEMLKDLEFKHINSRRKHTQYSSGCSRNALDADCYHYVIRESDAVLIADEWTDSIECRIEVLLAMRAGKHLLDENLTKAARFNSVNVKFQYDRV
jgi:hypothetical protein